MSLPSPELAISEAPSQTRSPGNRVVQGLLLSGGAVLLAVTAGADRIPFYWTPLILGLTYLVAAIVDGPRGGYWATALGLTGWGLAVDYMGEVRPTDIDTAGAYLAGVGLAGVVAAVLRRRGFLISDLGFAATVAAAGLTLALTPRASETLDDATTYAIALGVVGVLNVAGGAYQLFRPGPSAPGKNLSRSAARRFGRRRRPRHHPRRSARGQSGWEPSGWPVCDRPDRAADG